MQERQSFSFIRFCYGNVDQVYPLAATQINYMDLTYCISGHMHYIYENRDYILKEGDAILFPQGSIRERLKTDGPALYCSFNISYENFEPEVSGYIPNSIGFDTLRILESVKRSFDSVSDVKLKKCISLFLYLYYQLLETVENNENPHITHIKNFISKHYKENITLKQIADAVHLAPEYCCTLFSRYMGQTLFDFITTQRIEEAKSLILTTDFSLTKISQLTGFCDYNYFSRKFKKITGTNAKNYRKISIHTNRSKKDEDHISGFKK